MRVMSQGVVLVGLLALAGATLGAVSPPGPRAGPRAGPWAGPRARRPDAGPGSPHELPLLELRADDTRVTASCRVSVPEGLVIVDVQGDGVLQVAADDVRVVFEPGSVLRGTAVGTSPDRCAGFGVAVVGQRGVVIEGARLEGFAVGVLAREADGLVLQDIEVRDGFRQRLASTAAAADDSADWLAPHDNDAREWVTAYGAALCIEQSDGVTVQGCTARDVQNGLILDRVREARAFDNDFSYLSGWGMALWRVERSLITRNALDFCIRGYSHGVYNRGQDSAGLLMFEQCHDNLVAENSITHGGDGIFAFSGREALGEGGRDLGPGAHAGLGHHGNWFVDNDLSFAAAHGLELTFAATNVIRGNLFQGNAICGVWGGYSHGLVIAENRFESNGDAGYGLERGGVNVEHGRDLVVAGNHFAHNRCGVHLWWDEDSHLRQLPWARDNGVECGGNLVIDNDFDGDEVGVHLRSCSGTTVAGNRWADVGQELVVDGGPAPDRALPDRAGAKAPSVQPEWMTTLGSERPVGARPMRRGREHIVMTPWGPWDGESIAWHTLRDGASGSAFRLLGAPGALADLPPDAAGRRVRVQVDLDGDELTVGPAPGARGVLPWRLELPGAPTLSGMLLVTHWRITCFPSPCDPREDIDSWREAASGESAVTVERDTLDLPFGSGGPAELGMLDPPGTPGDAATFPRDHFGTRAEADVFLPSGRWRLATLSDDGLRVTVDGERLIDDWTWHAPTPHDVVLDIEEAREVHVVVEHFELDGWATLRVAWEPLGPDEP